MVCAVEKNIECLAFGPFRYAYTQTQFKILQVPGMVPLRQALSQSVDYVSGIDVRCIRQNYQELITAVAEHGIRPAH